MLLELSQWLAKDFRAFNVFSYITLRTVLAAMTALAISFVIGPWMIRRLTTLKIGQSVRDDGPQSHLVKAGTPTMGGALILASVTITTLLWCDLENRYVWVTLFATVGFGNSSALASAYGIAVTMTMFITTLLVTPIFLPTMVSPASTRRWIMRSWIW